MAEPKKDEPKPATAKNPKETPAQSTPPKKDEKIVQRPPSNTGRPDDGS